MKHTFKGVKTIIDKYAYNNGFRVTWSGRHSSLNSEDDASITGLTIHFAKRFSSPGKLALAFCHEIGHLAVDRMPHEKRRTRMEDEIAAWSMAHQFHRKIFKCNPDPKDERYISECLKTYTK